MPEFFLKGGSIIPTGPVMQHTAEKPLDPLTLLIALDSNGSATGTLYEDRGEGYEYQQGDFLLSTYTAERQGDTVQVRLAAAEGQRPRPNRALHVRLVLPSGEELKAQGRDGDTITIKIP
jgi:alpha-glucosidase